MSGLTFTKNWQQMLRAHIPERCGYLLRKDDIEKNLEETGLMTREDLKKLRSVINESLRVQRGGADPVSYELACMTRIQGKCFQNA